MVILVLNCRPASLRFRILDQSAGGGATELGAGSVAGIGPADAAVSVSCRGKAPAEERAYLTDHQRAISHLLERFLTDKQHGCLPSPDAVEAIGHRVEHGGERFTQPARITREVKKDIEDCARFAPGNHANLNGIWACERLLPEAPQVAVFDTAFHASLTPEAFLYAIPYKLYEDTGIRRYGGQGIAHAHAVQEATRRLDEERASGGPRRVVSFFLDQDASVCAARDGVCMDTSMGYTPAEGLIMGTRGGDIDPAVVLRLLHDYGLGYLERLIHNESGLKGLTGCAGMRDVLALASGKCPRGNAPSPAHPRRDHADIALAMYARRARKYIGAYAAVLGGLDAIAFSGDISENLPEIRARILEGMEWLGLRLDAAANEANNARITTDDSPAAAYIVHADEERIIAQETFRVLTC